MDPPQADAPTAESAAKEPIGEGGETVAIGDAAGQTRTCLQIAQRAIEELGLSLDHVVRTWIMLTDASRWKEAAHVHGEFFGEIKPACTFVEVSGFINPDWLVEIELDAVASR